MAQQILRPVRPGAGNQSALGIRRSASAAVGGAEATTSKWSLTERQNPSRSSTDQRHRSPSTRPDIGALTLATVFGLFNIVFGFSAITLGIQAGRLGKAIAAPTPAAA